MLEFARKYLARNHKDNDDYDNYNDYNLIKAFMHVRNEGSVYCDKDVVDHSDDKEGRNSHNINYDYEYYSLLEWDMRKQEMSLKENILFYNGKTLQGFNINNLVPENSKKRKYCDSDKNNNLWTSFLRKAGILSETETVVIEIESIFSRIVNTVIKDTLNIVRSKNSLTVHVDDVLQAVSVLEPSKYVVGFGCPFSIRYIWTKAIRHIWTEVVKSKKDIHPVAMSVLNDIATTLLTNLVEKASKLDRSSFSMFKKYKEYEVNTDDFKFQRNSGRTNCENCKDERGLYFQIEKTVKLFVDHYDDENDFNLESNEAVVCITYQNVRAAFFNSSISEYDDISKEWSERSRIDEQNLLMDIEIVAYAAKIIVQMPMTKSAATGLTVMLETFFRAILPKLEELSGSDKCIEPHHIQNLKTCHEFFDQFIVRDGSNSINIKIEYEMFQEISFDEIFYKKILDADLDVDAELVFDVNADPDATLVFVDPRVLYYDSAYLLLLLLIIITY